jgi:hypothetical protein
MPFRDDRQPWPPLPCRKQKLLRGFFRKKAQKCMTLIYTKEQKATWVKEAMVLHLGAAAFYQEIWASIIHEETYTLAYQWDL